MNAALKKTANAPRGFLAVFASRPLLVRLLFTAVDFVVLVLAVVRLGRLRSAWPASVTWLAGFILLHALQTSAEEKVSPEAVKLLRDVEAARLRVVSGQFEILVTSTPTAPPKHGTDRNTLKVVFDGQNRRFQTTRRELTIDASGSDGGQARSQKLDELGGDREAFVRLALGRWQETYYCTAYDGARLLQYSSGSGTVIDDPNHGSLQYVFDPRTLGLDTTTSLRHTLASCLGLQNAKSIALIAPKNVTDAKTWHVQVTNKWDAELDFWIDRDCPTHVVRFECSVLGSKQRDVAVSQYADCRPDSPLPHVVEIERFWNGKPAHRTMFEVRSARYNIPTDPRSWTLAGLNMPIGTDVSDVRIHRRIGYWDGTGLSEKFPRAARSVRPLSAPPYAGKLLALAEKDPKSALALDAVAWILVNTPEGPDVKAAADILIREHIQDKGLGVLCQRLGDRPSESVLRVLHAIVKRNPHRLPLAYASFTLAMHLKQKLAAADLSAVERSSLEREAKELFRRVASEYADIVDQRWGKLGPAATRQLYELETLEIGMLAPEIKGRDADGQPFQLSDYRGKVVLLCFSASWCGPCVALYPQKRALMKRYAGKLFAVLDVNADEDVDTVRNSAKEGQIAWRSWWDGPHGKIAETWNVYGWPTTYLIDRRGIIRAKNIRGKELDQAIERVMTNQ